MRPACSRPLSRHPVAHRVGPARGRPCLLLVAVGLVAGCSAGVNQELLATSTPYPIRTPVAAAPHGGGTPVPAVATAVATAVAARKAGDLPAALAAYDAAIALAPDQPDLYLARAEVARRRADFPAAKADHDRAIAEDPGNPDAYVERATLSLLLAQGDGARYQAAADDFNRALALDAAHPAARLGRARLALDRAAYRGDPADLDRALAELDALGAAASTPAANLLRAEVLAARGDVAGATQVLAAPVVSVVGGVSVDEADRASARAAVALAGRDWSAAIAAAEAALAVDPSRWEAYRMLAEAELGRGNPEAALAAADRLLAGWRENGPGLYLRGAALLRMGRVEEARQALTAANDRLPASPVYRARIAQALGSAA